MTTEPTPPIVCDMTDAPDTAVERLAEYRNLFEQSLIDREHTEAGIRFRFRAAPGVEARVRDLAAREQACCAFFSIAVLDRGDELWWEASVGDDDIARQILDELYRWPDTVADGARALLDRFGELGLRVTTRDSGSPRPATIEEH